MGEVIHILLAKLSWNILIFKMFNMGTFPAGTLFFSLYIKKV
jgi:hypothetical protein